VVEEPLDVLALERTSGFIGRYHVLHGVLSPIEGIGPDNLRIVELIARLRGGEVKEVILATNPSMEVMPPPCTCASRSSHWGCA
jgi:recombination protein RecR